jgi:arsenate reductase (glutaredoxin)
LRYHNPRCGKSRAALALLTERGVAPEIVEYLKNPPPAAELKRILKMLGLKPRELMRRKEQAYAENGLDDPQLSEETLVAAMVAHPILIERPIAVAGGKAALGRPPEKVLEVLA